MRRQHGFVLLLVLPSLVAFVSSAPQNGRTVDEEEKDEVARFATPCSTPNHQPALCVEIQKCAILFQQIIDRNNETYDFIRASSCGPPNAQQPKVCCGTYYNYVDKISTTVAPSTVAFSTTPQTAANNPLPKKCGKQKIVLNNRIFGGTEAELGDFPWLVRLKHKNKFNYTGYGCSGFLIHRRFVLTAAHCLMAKALEPLGPLYGVVLGAHNDNEDRECVTTSDNGVVCSDLPRFVETQEPVIHRNYDPSQHLHDIAIVQLKEKITFTEYIKAICLPFGKTNQSEFWLSGWGRTEIDMSSSKKLKVSVPRVNTSSCAERYRAVRMNVQETQLCAGGVGGKDSCSGDSGGPLMALDTDNLWYAEGIVSYGSGCGRDSWPGVYTNIPKYVHWIIETINSQTRTKSRFG